MRFSDGMPFTKGHGTANDFVLIPDLDGKLDLSTSFVAAVCDRRRGLGADGVLRVVPTASVAEAAHLADQAPWFMDYRNADGGAVEMCGNGIRVFARYLVDTGLADARSLNIATRDGVKQLWLREDGTFTVDMGTPRDVTRRDDGSVFVSMGNPHVVRFTDSLLNAPVTSEGAQLDARTAGGTNVEFVVVESVDRIAMRVWERGVGETASCGTGACASAVAAAELGRTGRDVAVSLPGGVLRVEWTPGDQVLMTGPAVLVADGELNDEWLKETM